MASPQPTPEGREFILQVRRTFDAPRKKVFAAWAEPKQLERWIYKSPKASEVIHHEQDIRSGGRWRSEIRNSAKGEVYWGQGTYLEITPPEKIVFTWSWTKEVPGGPNVAVYPESPESEVTVEFFARGEKTELVLTHRGLRSEKMRADHERGWITCLDEMEKTL